ncbi:DUF3768 domain-containing protein [Novosphingobium sp. HII-3]|uniref:DUF3768 domain-containing protein n=1 Tax=Novosphingobium sp. HII-3 TaxID=2075565 RepID=UPI000CDB6D3D|nr:DUF3768 domain-containing protein [Novosphingobium sp. HII-3]
MLVPTLNRTETIARLNDRARHGLDRSAKVVMTSNLLAHLSDGTLPGQVMAQAKVMRAARRCTFKPDSPERDFAALEIDGVPAFVKIDYFDPDLQFGSEDPADASVTRRVVTIMAREDY